MYSQFAQAVDIVATKNIQSQTAKIGDVNISQNTLSNVQGVSTTALRVGNLSIVDQSISNVNYLSVGNINITNNTISNVDNITTTKLSVGGVSMSSGGLSNVAGISANEIACSNVIVNGQTVINAQRNATFSNIIITGSITACNMTTVEHSQIIMNSEIVQSNLTVYNIATIGGNVQGTNSLNVYGSIGLTSNNNTVSLTVSNDTLVSNKIIAAPTFSGSGQFLYNIPSSAVQGLGATPILSQWSTSGNKVYISGSNIGIGTSTPTTQLDVSGVTKSTTFSGSGAYLTDIPTTAVVGLSSAISKGSQWTTTASLNAITVSGSNVGIDVANPTFKLEVLGTTKSTAFSGSGAFLTDIPANAIKGTLSQWQTTNSSNAIYITNSNVGIKTANPLYPLDVIGVVNATTFSGSGAFLTDIPSSAIKGTLSQWQTTNSSNAIYITSSNVGINVSLPAFPLEVGGIVKATTFSGSGANLTDIPASAVKGTLSQWQTTSSSNAIYITNSNVGVGTNSPLYPFHVQGNTFVDGFTLGNNGCSFKGFNIKKKTVTNTSVASSSVIFSSGTTEYGRFNNAGNFGIGTANPQAKLDVNGKILATSGNVGQSSQSAIFSVGPVNPANFNVYTGAGNAYSITGSATIQTTQNASWVASIYADGNIVSNTGFATASDERIKTNVTYPERSSCLEMASKIKVCEYNYVDKVQYGQHRKMGVLAQDVEAILPSCVNKSRQCIPNIMATFYILNAKTDLGKYIDQVKVGDAVKVLTSDCKETVETTITYIEGSIVTFDNSNINGNVFIVGTYVDDFRTVDYNQLFALTFGAIQELKCRIGI